VKENQLSRVIVASALQIHSKRWFSLEEANYFVPAKTQRRKDAKTEKQRAWTDEWVLLLGVFAALRLCGNHTVTTSDQLDLQGAFATQ